MGFTYIRPKADLIYGASGLRKTTNIGLIALYVKAKYGKLTRLVTCDGGGFDVLLPLVESGLIEPWTISNWPDFIEACDKASQGFWPVDISNPSKGLIAPTPALWEKIGFVAFEGLTSMGDSMLRYLSSKGIRLSQDPSYKWTDGKTTYSGANQSYYGEVQNRLNEFVVKSHLLPCERVLWTALEGKGEEDGTRAPIYGPAIAGKKSTGKATQWFGNSCHIEAMVAETGVDPKTKQIGLTVTPVMYLRTHADPTTKIPFPCKTRAPFQYATELPEYLDPPDMAELYRKLDALNDKVKEDLAKAAAQPAQPTSPPVPAAAIKPQSTVA